ncbi:M56 family metallopeptidase [Parapedobacter deserti]|uniref:M56 family metallopeptidase n=1 Tax=Parapedobacter deserti TaxID=1912957 RepID=A0ABV7JLC6_9SPHI
MEINVYNLIQALGWSMFHSLGLGACCYVALGMLRLANTRQSAAAKHNTALGMQIVVFVGFVASFVYYYGKYSVVEIPQGLGPAEMIRQVIADRGKPFSLESLFPYLAGGYLIGLAVQMLLLASSYVRLMTLKHTGLSPIPLPWIELFEQSRRKLGIQKAVSIYLSRHIAVPLTIGFVRPFVLFPFAYVNRLNADQVEAILLHELVHIKRQDFLCNLFKVAIETILFFNPFIWALSRVIAREREHACDDSVLQQLGTPMHYARALVTLEELRMARAPALSMAATGAKNQLLQRIKRMTNMESNKRNIKQQLIAVVASSLALFTIAMLIPAQPTNAGEMALAPMDAAAFGNAVVAVNTDTVAPAKPVPPVPPVDAKRPTKPAPPVPAVPPADTIVPKVPAVPDTARLPKKIGAEIKKLEKNAMELQKQLDAPEWKRHVAEVENQAAKLNAYFNSEEWKSKMDNITSYFESPEWKEQIAEMEKSAEGIERYFESPEWKAKVKKIEEGAKEIGKYFDSDKWKRR